MSVISAKAGIQIFQVIVDYRFRGNDWLFLDFYAEFTLLSV